jgi:hypothetical protein
MREPQKLPDPETGCFSGSLTSSNPSVEKKTNNFRVLCV